jgi:hypothetical protein
LLKTLRSVHTDVYNLRGGGPQGHYKRLLAYLEWTSNAVRMLSNQISDADLKRLVLTRGYELLLSGVGNMTGTEIEVQRAVNGLVSLELDQRVEAFEAAIKALSEQIIRWSLHQMVDGQYTRVPPSETFIVPDTGVYINHEKLEEADFGALLGMYGSPIRILVPMVVVDELDGLKQHNKSPVRWRAGYTLAVLDRLFAQNTYPTQPAQLHAAGTLPPAPAGQARGEVTVELLFDPPGHVRLPINDDEIVDRALAVEPLAGRKVTLLTYDTGRPRGHGPQDYG